MHKEIIIFLFGFISGFLIRPIVAAIFSTVNYKLHNGFFLKIFLAVAISILVLVAIFVVPLKLINFLPLYEKTPLGGLAFLFGGLSFKLFERKK
jgi:hypothetical protein